MEVEHTGAHRAPKAWDVGEQNRGGGKVGKGG